MHSHIFINRFIILALTLMLMGCQEQIKLGVEQTISTYPDIEADNIVNNLISINRNSKAIIAQVTLRESLSTATDGFNYGASPNIAFRAIALTGLTATASNSLVYNWAADPVNGSLDQYRLQLLFGYALGKIDSGNFQSFEKSLLQRMRYADRDVSTMKGSANEKMAKDSDDKAASDYLRTISYFESYLPSLPDHAFAFVDDPKCNSNSGKDHEVRATLSLETVCFKSASVDGRYESGAEVAGALALWASAIPEISAATQTPGGSVKGTTSLSVSTSGK